MSSSINITPIGVIRTPYADKFAVPRQSLMAGGVRSVIEFFRPYSDPQAFTGIEDFSHLHVLFFFDRIEDTSFHPMVRPPRLGGNRKIGVFATRSPFRPSRIGLSVLRLGQVIHRDGEVSLEVYGADMADGTPVLDIKPYLPYADCIEGASAGYAQEEPRHKRVEFDPSLSSHPLLGDPETKENLESILGCDPRPAYRPGEDDGREYRAVLYGHTISFCVKGDTVFVRQILQS